MNSQSNLFWPVYKNLEKEFLQLSNYIHFSDDQAKVYSLHIADLIIRCAVEIEAISKELYYSLGGNPKPLDKDGKERELYFDTDCLALLESSWALSKKQIAVSAATFYFSDETNKCLTPLHKAHKRGSSGSKWKQAYQAVKHDRINSLKLANIGNLLNAMGALFILNAYYRSHTFSIGYTYLNSAEFDSRIGSDIFSVSTYCATMITMSPQMDDTCINVQKNESLESSIYIFKYEDESFRRMHECYWKDHVVTVENVRRSPEIAKFLTENPNYQVESLNKLCIDVGGMDFLKKIICFSHTRDEHGTKTEAVINKGQPIYPTLVPPDSSAG